jgi:hypothetical protein
MRKGVWMQKLSTVEVSTRMVKDGKNYIKSSKLCIMKKNGEGPRA